MYLEMKYINIVISENFFLPELEEMKSCIFLVETENAGMVLQWILHHLLVLWLVEMLVLTPRESAKERGKSLHLSISYSEYC